MLLTITKDKRAQLWEVKAFFLKLYMSNQTYEYIKH